MQSIIRQILGYAKIVLFVGLLMLGFSFYSRWEAVGGHAYAPYEQLTRLPVYVNSAKHVTEKGKRGSVRKRYYELTVSNRNTDQQHTLRMDASVSEDLIGNLVEEKIDVLVDENNHSLIYQVTVVDESNNEHLLLPYEATQKQLQAKAEDNAKDPFFPIAGSVLTLLGALGIWLRRKRQQV